MTKPSTSIISVAGQVQKEDKQTGKVIKRIDPFNGLDRSLLVKHLVIEDIHNSWFYCFTNPLELGTRVSLSQEGI